MKHSIVARLLISLLGLALMLWGISTVTLWFAGESATAVITSIHREGGERSDGKPGRYTYSIGYTFTLSDGRRVDGSAKKIGGAVYVKADGTSTAPVRYLKVAPFINTLEENTRPSFGQPALVVAGILLIIVMNRKNN
ncbi:MAG: hypothetical protein K6U74_14645 [Firmicutes bacterium]|nr:hypothetical protein [Bacillota bacterium]